ITVHLQSLRPIAAAAVSLKAKPLCARLFLVGVQELLADTRRFARPIAKIVELRPSYVALALHLDAGDKGRIGLKRSFHAFAARYLAHDKRRIEPAIALGDHHTFVRLHALAFAFDDIHVDDDRVTGRKR